MDFMDRLVVIFLSFSLTCGIYFLIRGYCLRLLHDHDSPSCVRYFFIFIIHLPLGYLPSVSAFTEEPVDYYVKSSSILSLFVYAFYDTPILTRQRRLANYPQFRLIFKRNISPTSY